MIKQPSKMFKSSLRKNISGFTLVELTMVGLICSFVIVGIYGVFFKVANTYSEEQRTSNIQHEGEWILNLIENGGGYKGERIYGLNAMINPDGTYPKIGNIASTNFNSTDPYGYRIEFPLDDVSSNKRFAEFSVYFESSDVPTAKLYFRIIDEAGERYVLLSDKLLMERFDSTPNPATYGNYNRTSFKAKTILDDSSPTPNVIGIRISFYLVDFPPKLETGEFHAVRYNYQLDRELDPPIVDDRQRQSLLGTIPYPQYFSRTIYFPNEN